MSKAMHTGFMFDYYYAIYTWVDWDSNLLKKWEKGLPEKLGNLCIRNYIGR